ncbi:MAG TPA: hypothetical protein VGG53_07730 [Mycobacterium sp.]|uniref:hypothetical protein n=1 Tax=Mycobacterium sp. TaxID=1785 RepID=UPI002F4142D1
MLPHMVSRGHGRAVNIGADSVRTELMDHAMYNAAKGGVHAMSTTRSASRTRPARVCAASPTWGSARSRSRTACTSVRSRTNAFASSCAAPTRTNCGRGVPPMRVSGRAKTSCASSPSGGTGPRRRF